MKSIYQVFAGDFVSKVLLGLSGLALIRFMPTTEYAVFTLATVISMFVIQGISGNLNYVYLVGRKKLGIEDAPQLFLAMQIWLIALVALFATPIMLLASPLAGLFGLIVALTLANCLLEFAKTFYQQQLRFAVYSLIEFCRAVVFVLALAGLIFFQGDQLRVWHVLTLQLACVSTVVLIAFGRRIEWSSLLNVKEIWSLTRQVFASRYCFMIGYFFGLAMLTRIDVFMLGLLDSEFQLSTFGASFRYYCILMLLLNAFHTVFLPLTQQATTRLEVSKLFSQHRRMIVVAIPVILTGAWASGWIIPLIDGGKYPGAVDVFRVLSLSAIISLAFSPHANLLLRYEGFRFLFVICAGAILLNVGLNALLIPRWHAVGAAWGTLVASGGVNALIYVRSRSLLANHPLPDNTSAPESRRDKALDVPRATVAT